MADLPTCNICGRTLNMSFDTRDCGGDCLRCMATIGTDPDCIQAAFDRIEELEQHRRVGDWHPPAHAVCRVQRVDRFFDATPCYGMHAPWWVPRNGWTGDESEPIPMEPDDHYTLVVAKERPFTAPDR